MSHTLEKDVCHLGGVGTRIEEVQLAQVNQYLPEYVRYACCHWVDHLRQSNVVASDNGKLHAFLKKHFINWVEAMALIKRVPAGTLILIDLLTYISTLLVR